jgi:hypothetical protein
VTHRLLHSPRRTSLPVLLQNHPPRPPSASLPPSILPIPPLPTPPLAKTIPFIPTPPPTWPLFLSSQITLLQTTTTSVPSASSPSASVSGSQARNLTLFPSAVMPSTRSVFPVPRFPLYSNLFRPVLLPSMAPLQVSKVEPPPGNPISVFAAFADDP